MSAFEDFVQLELPKRPYLNTDPPQETVMVRRGLGPRQLAGVQLTEGQVLAMIGGQIVGTTLGSLGGAIKKYVQVFGSPQFTWIVNHALNSQNAIIQAFNTANEVILPDEIQIVDANNIELTFNTPQAGTVRVIFLD